MCIKQRGRAERVTQREKVEEGEHDERLLAQVKG